MNPADVPVTPEMVARVTSLAADQQAQILRHALHLTPDEGKACIKRMCGLMSSVMGTFAVSTRKERAMLVRFINETHATAAEAERRMKEDNNE